MTHGTGHLRTLDATDVDELIERIRSHRADHDGSASDLAAYYADYADALLERGLVSPAQHARMHELVGDEGAGRISVRSMLGEG